MDWRLVLDLVVSVLLVATIGYAIALNSRLGSLRRNRSDLAKTIVSFNEATLRAETAIPKLRRAAEEAGGALQDRVEKAQSLRDDLAFMIERADTMANRLENAVRSARIEVRPQNGPASARLAAEAADLLNRAPARSAAEAADSVNRAPARPAAEAADSMNRAPARPAAEAADSLNRAPARPAGSKPTGSKAAQRATVAAAGAASEEVDVDERSEAERELLRALQSMR